MSIIQESSALEQALPVRGKRVMPVPWRSEEELKLRELIEAWGRERWPGSRVVHELTVGRGNARCDMAFIGEKTFRTIEIKSSYDSTERLLHQVAMFRLVSPETWLVAARHHDADKPIVHHLFPSVGILSVGPENQRRPTSWDFEVRYEPQPFVHHKEAMLSMLWARELANVCGRHGRHYASKIPTCKSMLTWLNGILDLEQATAEVCHELRRRDALWRADAPLAHGEARA